MVQRSQIASIDSAKRTSLLLLTAAAASASAQSTAVFGNLGEGLDANNTDITSTVKLGLAFNTGASSLLFLDSVKIGVFVSATDNYTVSLYTGSSTAPNLASGLFATSSLNLVSQDSSVFTFDFGGIELAANTTYWILPEQGVSWYTAASYATADELNSSGYTFISNRRSSNGGATWSNFLVPFSAKIYASPAPIPEPSTYGLILGGLALAGVAVRRRQKAAK